MRLAILLAIAVASCLDAAAQNAPAPEVIARQTVNNREQRVVFRLGRQTGQITALSVRTGGEPVLIRSLEIVFAGGGRRSLGLDEWITAGEATTSIDFGPDQIEQVIVWKQPSVRPGRADLQLLGVVSEPVK